MGLVRLTIRNAGRAPVRGMLTVVAVATTLVAFMLLRALSSGWTERIEQTPNDRVVTRHKVRWGSPLPVQYVDEVRHLPGVKRALGAVFLDLRLPGVESVFFQSAATDAKDFVDMHHELEIPADQKAAFVADRRGALVSKELADEQGWKPGDELHLVERASASTLDLTLSGIAESTRFGFGQRSVWIHYEYYNERRLPPERDQVMMLTAQVEEPREIARMVQAIDIHFDSQSDQTFSLDDKALNTALVGQFGAMLEAMNLVSLLVLGLVVLILGNTVAMATRERTREFGTLRAIGFSPRHLVAFVLGEAATLGFAGGLLGLVLGVPLVRGPFSRYLQEELGTPALQVPIGDALEALALGALLGALAALLPARRAARMEVTASLSHLA
jgi:putative ABC transport system permease protein